MRKGSPLTVALVLAASQHCTADGFRPSLALEPPGGSHRHAMRAAALASYLAAAAAHPKYLEYLPNGKNSYFGSLPGMSSDGAIGHDTDRSGAHLNPFGKEYPGGDSDAFGLSSNRGGGLSEPFVKPMRKAVRLAQACHAEDVDRVELNHADDDDDDHHHHKGPVWDIKFCCKDADNDGQYNGWELGDPCCTWKKDGSPSTTTGISHPGVSSQLPPRLRPAPPGPLAAAPLLPFSAAAAAVPPSPTPFGRS